MVMRKAMAGALPLPQRAEALVQGMIDAHNVNPELHRVLLDEAPGRVDLQLETPQGAVALREWAGEAPRVLLKTQDGPLLVSDPWQVRQVAA